MTFHPPKKARSLTEVSVSSGSTFTCTAGIVPLESELEVRGFLGLASHCGGGGNVKHEITVARERERRLRVTNREAVCREGAVRC